MVDKREVGSFVGFGPNKLFLILIGYYLNLSPCENLGILRLMLRVMEVVLLTLLAPTCWYVFFTSRANKIMPWKLCPIQ